jgi:hypothetical protein
VEHSCNPSSAECCGTLSSKRGIRRKIVGKNTRHYLKNNYSKKGLGSNPSKYHQKKKKNHPLLEARAEHIRGSQQLVNM